MIELNDGNFAEYANGVLVIDFWAEWCGPCKTLGPSFSAVAERFGGEANFAKVDVDSSPDLARTHHVMSIPTILVIRDGSEIGRLVGSRGATQLQAELQQILA